MEIYDLEEYLVVITETSRHGRQAFVIGLDDNYNLFCHNLPQETIWDIDPRNLTIKSVRDMMGFDLHSWEISDTEIPRGLRIRLQGDLVIRVEEKFADEDELFAYLYLMGLEKLLESYRERLSSIFIKCLKNAISQKKTSSYESTLSHIRRALYSLDIDTLRQSFNDIRSITGSQDSWRIEHKKGFYVDAITHIIDRLVTNIIREICSLERILNIVIGNHRVRIIGVDERDVLNMFHSVHASRDFLRIYVLRPHTIVALHDEHKSVFMDIPRGIITISTLRTGPLQVVRWRRITPEGQLLVRIKVVVVAPPEIEPWRILPKDFRPANARRFTSIGAEFYMYRDSLRVDSINLMYDLVIWYINTSDVFSNVRDLYYRGARMGIIIVNLVDKESIVNLKEYTMTFWKNVGAPWPVIVVGYKPYWYLGEEPESSKYCWEYVKKISQYTILPSRYIEIRESNKNILRNIIIEYVRQLISNVYLRARGRVHRVSGRIP